MRWRHAIAAAALALGASACQQPLLAAEKAVEAPAAKRAAKEGSGLKTAIFAGGCFWCMESPFDQLDGVISTTAVDPRLERIGAAIDAELPLELMDPEPFVELSRPPRLGRFSRYWRDAEPVVWQGYGVG